jgi:hypothetical protein
VAVKSANAAYHHVRTINSNSETIQLLSRKYGALCNSLVSLLFAPKLDTHALRDAIASIHEYFSFANVELEGINGTRHRVGIHRVVTPREVEGVLNGLLIRLRHVELLVVNLDGFANVGHLVDAVGSLVIDDRRSLRAQGDDMFAGLCRIERLIQSQSSGLASINLSNDALRDLLKAVEEIGANQRASATAGVAISLSRPASHLTAELPTGSNGGLLQPSSGIALDQDAITARYAQVDPKVIRFVNAVQKGHMSSADKDKVVVVIRRLLEP